MRRITLFVSIILLTACHKKEEKKAHKLSEVKNLNTIELNYPNSKKDTTVYDSYLNGTEKVADPYQWLEDDRSKETEKWVNEQNAVTEQYLNQIPYKKDFKQRLKELLQYERVGLPYKKGDYYFISKNNGLQNQSVTYYKKGKDGKETIFLDPNSMSEKGTTSANVETFSKDKKLASIGINEAGSDWKTIKIKNIETNEYLKDVIEQVKFSPASWYKDGFFYSRFPKTKGSELSEKNEFHSVYYHKLGTPQDQDILVYMDTEPETYNNIWVSDDENYFILSSAQGTGGNKINIAKATQEFNKIDWRTVMDDYESQNSIVDVKNGKFYLLTDYQAPNQRLVTFDFEKYEESDWKEVLPESKSLLESVSFSGGKLFANYLENASTKIYQFDVNGQSKKEVQLPGIGTAGGFKGEDEDTSSFYYFTSFTYPTTIFEYDIASGKSSIYFQPQLQFNPADYETKQVWYSSKDGTKVPMFVTAKKGLDLNGDNPTYLYAYGGFNINIVPSFKTNFIPFLEEGGIYAIPNLRGGGEFGAEWHKAGMLTKKQNVFDDFIAAAEYLINEKYTRKEKLAIAGGSNGGLLIGACMTQRPDLYQVAYPAVGVMDMLKYHTFTIGWGWADEYGRSDDGPEMFHYLKGYSPLHNVKKGTKYPSTMVLTADHDDRVVPAHSFKFIAEVQEKHKGDNPVLIRIEKDAGHGAGKPISKQIEESADVWSFLFYNMGYEQLPSKKKM
ncbi:prolyl oligopeptidase [Flavobacteriaceae bacterium UJ101]|nr:prolyl oligopeptidase [Flavobacteriaceae bacterium UJ101]